MAAADEYTLPSGMVEVSRERFFAYVGPRNVHPRPEREHSDWEVAGTREVVGRSLPGYMGWTPYSDKRVYMLSARALEAAPITASKEG